MKLETFLEKAFNWYYEENIHNTNIGNDEAVKLFRDTEIFKKFEQQVNGADMSQDQALNLADVSGELCPRCNSPLIYKRQHTEGYSCNNCFHDWA